MLAAIPAGVVVVAAPVAGGFRGMTVTSFAAVSLEPPLVLLSAEGTAATAEAVQAAGRFSASLLERSQEFLAERFAGRAPAVSASWQGVPHRLSPSGLPYVEAAVAWFDCEVETTLEAGDHVIFVGVVKEALRGPGEPLVHWDRGFWRLA